MGYLYAPLGCQHHTSANKIPHIWELPRLMWESDQSLCHVLGVESCLESSAQTLIKSKDSVPECSDVSHSVASL